MTHLSLFDDEPFALPPTVIPNGIHRVATGAVSEYLATVKLLELGHKVAKPVVDDAGVDLVVDYRTTVQVKGSRSPINDGGSWVFAFGSARLLAGGGKTERRPPDADILACHAQPIDTWWILPMRRLREAGFNALTLSLSVRYPVRTTKLSSLAVECVEAWHLLRELAPEGG